MKRSGDRFEYFKSGNLWYWHLVVAHSPSPVPVAKSGRGYPTKKAALKAIKSATLAAKGAMGEPLLVDAPQISH
jgi:hypothetical protein